MDPLPTAWMTFALVLSFVCCSACGRVGFNPPAMDAAVDSGDGPRDSGVVDSGDGAADSSVVDADAGDTSIVGPDAADTSVDAGVEGCPLPDPDTVALYTFDGTVDDSAGGVHGSAVGTVAYGAGRCGDAIELDDTADAYGVLPADAVFDIGPVGSIDLWFRTPATPTAHFGLVSRDHSGSATPGQVGLHVTIDGSAFARIQASGTSVVICSDAGLVTPGVWHHMGVNFGPPGFELYLDGVRMDATRDVPIDEPPSGARTLPCGSTTDIDLTGSGGTLSTYLGANNGYSPAGAPDSLRSFLHGGGLDHLRFSRVRRDFTVYAATGL
ncbi:MAG: hypothetical protein DRJ42_27415 [Deltaproteobacteria bacterium]|nr:MAG: hypothetical protein DRJ42_27415 [Deltaproteobacteria bacterium]